MVSGGAHCQHELKSSHAVAITSAKNDREKPPKHLVAFSIFDGHALELPGFVGEETPRQKLAKSLESFIREDGFFKKSPMDAYSQAWALAFYLAETRSVEFARYLKTVASRNPLEQYDGDARMKDFRDAFGRDLEFLEDGMLRFYNKMGQ